MSRRGDIVALLRQMDSGPTPDLAADEIERLRAALQDIALAFPPYDEEVAQAIAREALKL